jgi:putative nucleotidyltransferase with HDIG domain
MRAKILKLLPELRKIKDKELKEKVILAWEMGIFEGGYKEGDLKKICFTLLIPECKVSLIQHTRAVANTALAIAKDLTKNYVNKVKVNYDYLIAGGLLHDVGKLLEYRIDKNTVCKSKNGKFLRHSFSGTALAYVCGIPAEVLHIIAVHSKEGDTSPRSIEAMIVHYADYIHFEALGGKL